MVSASHHPRRLTLTAASLLLLASLVCAIESIIVSVVIPSVTVLVDSLLPSALLSPRSRRSRRHVITPQHAHRLRMLSSVVDAARPAPSSEDRLSNQPQELTMRMLWFLPPQDLARLAEANTWLYRLANEDCFWKAHCQERWSSKKHAPLALHPRVDYAYILPQLTDADLTAVLYRRFVRKLPVNVPRAYLEERLAETVPEDAFTPFYSGKWKASYIAAEVDKTRQRITRDEVVEYEWVFSDSWGWGYGMGEDAEGEEIRIRFWPDGMRSNVNRDKKFARPRPQPWHLDERGAIQVSQFPQHSVPERTSDWGWTFSNGYVTYTSTD
ncbi:hypothetical protein HDU96_010482 [Phlyctochytrium bullatum]|nr:hypothetical protein HDU96_010482 [Phlyctochytrium bullatum]